MSDIAHSYNFLVREDHLDTFGHVNNAVYLELFEEARWDWITKNGYGLEEIKKTGLGPVVLEVHLVFKRELKLRQEITVDSTIMETKGKISTLKQEMRDKDRNLCCEAVFTFALFDLNKRKIVTPTEQWKKALS